MNNDFSVFKQIRTIQIQIKQINDCGNDFSYLKSVFFNSVIVVFSCFGEAVECTIQAGKRPQFPLNTLTGPIWYLEYALSVIST